MYIRLYAMPLEQTDHKLPGAQDYKFCCFALGSANFSNQCCILKARFNEHALPMPDVHTQL